MNAKEYKEGDEIVYIPNHAGDIHHSDCEYGFVTSVKGETIFCRFYRKRDAIGLDELRTIANSEGCNARNIFKLRDASGITKTIIKTMKANPEMYGWPNEQ